MAKLLSHTVPVLMLLSLALILTGCFSSTSSAGSIKLSDNGKALSYIVTDDKYDIWSDRFAADELAEYLHKITGASFKTIKAGEEKEEDSCIYLNNIAAKKLGVDRNNLSGQEWIITTKGNDIFITGGKRDGTLSAVYYFLEKFAGLRFWNMKETLIPETPDLTIPACDIRKKPDFVFRGCQGMENPDSLKFGFDSLTKVLENGQWKRMRDFRDRATPIDHGLVQYYVKNDMFEKHPEWFAEINGKRTLAANDLCLTNPDLPEYVAQKLIQQIEHCKEVSQKGKIAAPFIYSIAREDNAQWCQCPACKGFGEAHRKSGVIVDFVNKVARKVQHTYPDITISTHAYQSAAAPPVGIVPEDNVAVQYCFEKRNMARPLTDESNLKTLNELQGWAKISKRLYVWDYAMSFAKFHNRAESRYDFPVPSMLHMAQDLRLCRELGVSGIYVQNPSLEERDSWGLKNWMISKLYFDTSLDNETLMRTYLEGYFGPASKGMREYIQALYDADQRKPSRIWFYADLAEYQYLDMKFYMDAEKAFKEAEQAVANDSLYLDRVKAERFTLTRALLFSYSKLMRTWCLGNGSDKGFPFDPKVLLEELKNEYKSKAKLIPCGFSCISGYTVPEYSYAKFLEDIPKYEKLVYYKHLPIPDDFKGHSPQHIYDYPAGADNFEARKPSALVADDSTPAGKTYETSIDIAQSPICWKFQPRWEAAAWEHRPNSDERKQIGIKEVKGKGYQWYKLGTYYFEGTSTGLLFFDDSNLAFWGDVIGRFEVWAYLKFASASLPFCDKDVKPSVSLSRIILTPPAIDQKIYGSIELPQTWTVFPGFSRNDSIGDDYTKSLPEQIMLHDKKFTPLNLTQKEGKIDLAGALGGAEDGKTAFVYIPFEASKDEKTTFGFGADWWLCAWIDGDKVCDTMKSGNGVWPPTVKDYIVTVDLKKGKHLLLVKFISGSGSSVLAVGAPEQIRKSVAGD
ncbi:MAG TPA: hypothetical protein DET40_10855 [Lentisphaeria bacterium]|nr:MAG: hypothetical protein A2X45_11480 [Lentisphaerae bacterium GWF2_50_93]HCE44037.1 hypothetical protein [Lentisphaeria bacterium]